MKKVLLLTGGFSSEREVSLSASFEIQKALQNKGYDVIYHDLTDTKLFIETINKEKPDVVFNGLYGNFGEDGEIQGLLDMLSIPYTHSSLKTSVLAMNKDLTKLICIQTGIKTADFEVTTYQKWKKEGTKLPIPYVIKPVSDGSSVGVFIIHHKTDEQNVFYPNEAQELIVEKYIKGRELTVSVFKDKPCAVTELKPKTGFYDYKAKYTNGETTHILPAEIPEDVYRRALQTALKVHRLLDCRTVSRSDFRYNEKDGLVFLEINVNPGMTPLSLVPEQLRFIGISFEDLCDTLIKEATCRNIKSL